MRADYDVFEALFTLAREARVDPIRVWQGTLTAREFRELAEAAARLSYAGPIPRGEG